MTTTATEQKTESGKLKSEPQILTEVNEGNKGGNGSRLFIGIDLLTPDPEQPRKFFDEEKLKELAESVKQPAGIVSDILVRKTRGDWFIDEGRHGKDMKVRFFQVLNRKLLKGGRYERPDPIPYDTKEKAAAAVPLYEILDGERRWRAAKLAGLSVVPIAIREVADATVVQLLANQQRENLSALEEAEAYRKQVNAGKKPEELAKELGLSRATVYGRLVLTRLTTPVREALLAGKISTSVAGLVAMVPGEVTQKELLEACRDRWNGPVSFRGVQNIIDKSYLRQLSDAPFDVKDGALLAKAGACEACPKRSGNMTGEFPDLAKRPNVCTDPECFRRKVRADSEKKVAAAKAAGSQVLSAAEAKGLFGVRHDGSVYTQGEFNTKYADLNDRCEPLGWDYKNHWRAALGKAAPKPVLVVDPNGELHELVPKEEALKVLKESGKLKKTTNYSDDAYTVKQRKEQAKRQKAEKRYVRAVNAAVAMVLPKVAWVNNGQLQVDNRVAKLLAMAAYEWTSIDAHAQVAKGRGLTKVQTDAREKLVDLLKETTDAAALMGLAVELLVATRWNAAGYHGGPKFSEEFLDLCKVGKVDPVKIEKGLPEKEGKPKAKIEDEEEDEKDGKKTKGTKATKGPAKKKAGVKK
jgi:ParB/RepB/Spo0J family partition protein